MLKFPRDQNSVKNGWKIDPKFLSKVSRYFHGADDDWNPTMESTEVVLLALERIEEFDKPDYESLFLQAVKGIASIHESIGLLPEDAEGAGPIIEEIERMTLEMQRYIDADRQKTNEINILTKENRRLSDEIFFSGNNGNINQFFPHMDIIDQQNIMIAAYNKWRTENTPHREKMAFFDGFNAAMLLIEGEK